MNWDLYTSRIIEVDAQDTFLFDVLSEKKDIPKYIALVHTNNFSKLGKKLNKHITAYTDTHQISRNSTDILVLSGVSVSALWIFHNVAHVQTVLVPITTGCLPGILKQVLLRRMRIVQMRTITTGEGKSKTFIELENRLPRKAKARHYISPIQGIENFFSLASNFNYVILRWFETLPAVSPGEDIDILVSDADIDTFIDLFKEYPGTIPCDVYSESGKVGSDYNKIAYYPPYLAKKILASSIQHERVFKVPNSEHHALSLAYHALYHKGGRSGIPSQHSDVSISVDPEHHYTEALQHLGIRECETLEEYDVYLEGRGWQPPKDTLRRLAKTNEWVRIHFNFGSCQEGGLCVFIVRDRALKSKVVDDIKQMIFDEGFSILRVFHLNEHLQKTISQVIRGGNWDRGPWPVSGGLPAVAIITNDVLPQPPSEKQRIQYPHLSNARILVKHRIRDVINARFENDMHSNILHSSDNMDEALEYLNTIFSHAEVAAILSEAIEEDIAFLTTEPVLQDMTHNGRRAKVELITFNEQHAVKKTFRKGRERFLEREIFVSENLGRDCKWVPSLLDKGPNYIIYPYYENTLRLKYGRLLPLPIVVEAINALRFFYDNGYFLFDAHPTNLIYDKKAGLKLIDFEFIYPYEKIPNSFEESYDIVGAPHDFKGDQPIINAETIRKTYTRCWYPYIGLSLKSLLYDPLWLKHLKRLWFVVHTRPGFWAEDVTHWGRRVLRTIFLWLLWRLRKQ